MFIVAISYYKYSANKQVVLISWNATKQFRKIDLIICHIAENVEQKSDCNIILECYVLSLL
jgi:hypothetical protein